jgi:hypothetical protein
MTEAPERIRYSSGTTAAGSTVMDGPQYILATPTALAAAPEVIALIDAAVAKEREACAALADEKATGYEGENNEAAWACSKPVAVRLRGLAAAIRARTP